MMIFRKSKFALTCILASLLMQGCSWFKEKPPEYIGSDEGSPLDIPQDMDALVYVRPIEVRVAPMRIPSGDELDPRPPMAVATGGRGDANAVLAWSAAGVYLQVQDSPESVARRLGFAIERSGMRMIERHPDGSHEFEYVQLRVDNRGFFEKMMFWRNDGNGNHSGVYRTRVDADGENSRVFLTYPAGQPASTASAEHVLVIFMERLG